MVTKSLSLLYVDEVRLAGAGAAVAAVALADAGGRRPRQRRVAVRVAVVEVGGEGRRPRGRSGLAQPPHRGRGRYHVVMKRRKMAKGTGRLVLVVPLEPLCGAEDVHEGSPALERIAHRARLAGRQTDQDRGHRSHNAEHRSMV